MNFNIPYCLFRSFVLLLMLSGCLISCNKNEKKDTPEVPFAIKAYFGNGDSLVIQEGLNGVNSYGRAGGVIDTLGNYFELQSTFFNKGSSKVSVNFMQTFSNQPDNAQIEGIFHSGDYVYGSSIPDSLNDGVEVQFIDTAGAKWSSAFGSQTNAAFTLTGHTQNSFDDFTPFLSSGNFHCMLFDSAGNALEIISAEFTGRTVVYP